jgi:hypothetical protein|tara:strand:- start:265 stop:648 length:384 start_codon:yes stop_codon:yes gene_type:complete
MNHLLLTLLLIASTTLTFFLMNAFGFMLITTAVILMLTASYAIKYRREGAGVGLAYFGLAYVGFGLAFFGIGLLQTHAGCMFLIGDCYQHGLPSYWLEAKVGVNSGVKILNGLALTFVYLNLRRTDI